MPLLMLAPNLALGPSGPPNLITQQSLADPYWTLSGMVDNGANHINEVASVGAHTFGTTTPLARPAGTGAYFHSVDLIKLGSDQRFLFIGLFATGLGSGLGAYFDVLNGTASVPSSYGGFSNPTPAIAPIAGGFRCSITTGILGGSLPGLVVLEQDSTPLGTFSYQGVAPDGYIVSNIVLNKIG